MDAPLTVSDRPKVCVLVTADRARLATLLSKGILLQGWEPCFAFRYESVVQTIQRYDIDVVLLDADHFQSDTIPLLVLLDREEVTVVVLAEDYQIGGWDLRQVVAVADIVIKPFSTRHLMTLLRQKIVSVRDCQQRES